MRLCSACETAAICSGERLRAFQALHMWSRYVPQINGKLRCVVCLHPSVAQLCDNVSKMDERLVELNVNSGCLHSV